METPQLKNSPRKKLSVAEWAIVAVIVALLFAMVYPTFNEPRIASRDPGYIVDGRILGNSAQQYFLASGQTVVTAGYDSKTGELSGDLTPWVKVIGKGYTIGDLPIEKDNPKAFSIALPGISGGKPIYFSDEGKTTVDPNSP